MTSMITITMKTFNLEDMFCFIEADLTIKRGWSFCVTYIFSRVSHGSSSCKT